MKDLAGPPKYLYDRLNEFLLGVEINYFSVSS